MLIEILFLQLLGRARAGLRVQTAGPCSCFALDRTISSAFGLCHAL